MSRLPALLYSTVSCTVFLLTFLYAAAFIGGFGVPHDIDHGRSASQPVALAIDLTLLALFAVQHSGMARPAFKRWWNRFMPSAIERSTCVLISSLTLALLFWQWHSLPLRIWQVDYAPARWLLYAVSAAGWLLLLSSTFLIDHFDLFGLRQVWRYAQDLSVYRDTPLLTRTFHRIVRHPLMLGFLMAFWATPSMSLGHLLFALVNTGYILVAVKFLVERDLVAQFGDIYRNYQRQLPMFPSWRTRHGQSPVRCPRSELSQLPF